MVVEHARALAIPKPWGVGDLQPWSNAGRTDGLIGEIWFERSAPSAPSPALLLKLLFTDQALSIQVHPDDAYARSIGLPNGKAEAWHILSATAQSEVALGLKRRLTPAQLRQAVDDGSIADLVAWRPVSRGDTIFVPAGTIHAIGAGLVLAEIQQRSDTTFRLFDQGRARELHIENAIAAADAGPAKVQAPPRRIAERRILLLSNPHFTLEKIGLAPRSDWRLDANQESWLLVIGGDGNVGSFEVVPGEAIFAQSDRVLISAGSTGLIALVAYTGAGPIAELLQALTEPDAAPGPAAADAQLATFAPAGPAMAASMGTRQ